MHFEYEALLLRGREAPTQMKMSAQKKRRPLYKPEKLYIKVKWFW
jgi:hypothetical protein